MRILYSKFCEYSCQLLNGRHSMIGIFDNIRAPAFPLDHPPFFICVEVEFEPGESDLPHAFTFSIIDEDGKPVLRFEGPPAVLPRDPSYSPQRIHMTVGIGGIRFEKPGAYRLDVECDGQKVGEELLPVIKVDLPPGMPGQPMPPA